MSGRQSGVSGETRRSGEAGGSQSLHNTDAVSSGREGRLAKPLRGKGGRKLDARGLGWRKRIPAVPTRLSKGETPPVGRPPGYGGRKRRSGRIAWCRRWATASKEANGSAWWIRSSARRPWKSRGASRGEQRGCGGGWPERGEVRKPIGTVSARTPGYTSPPKERLSTGKG